jgi:hypothetical protein
MDILYTGKVDGFCIISSDSDFTRLATRLREAGMKVIGMGEKKTLKPFITACDKFIYLEILKVDDEQLETKKLKRQYEGGRKSKEEPMTKVDQGLNKLLRDSIADIADENGWAFLGELGNLLLKKKPDFDPRNYGYPKLLPLIRSLGKIEVDERETGRKNVKHVYVKSR